MAEPAVPAQERVCHIALLGFGTANRVFAQLLLERLPTLASRGLRVQVTAIFTGSHGSVWCSPAVENIGQGIPLQQALDDGLSEGATWLQAFAGTQRPGRLADGECVSALQGLRQAALLDVLIEATPADYERGEPALPILREMLRLGVHVASANKVPVVLAHDELKAIAAKSGCSYLFESACMDGIPIFNMARKCLPTAKILAFEGILNSTTNVILSAMEESAEVTFEEGLRSAQAMGIVETDPSGDIDGLDAAVKCVCLARALFRTQVQMKDVSPLDGIRKVDQAAVAAAREDGGCRLMLVCKGSLKDPAAGPAGGATCSVQLCPVPPSDPKHGIRGASSCLTLFTDVLGALTLTQTDPTNRDTGYGLLADLLEAAGWAESV